MSKKQAAEAESLETSKQFTSEDHRKMLLGEYNDSFTDNEKQLAEAEERAKTLRQKTGKPVFIVNIPLGDPREIEAGKEPEGYAIAFLKKPDRIILKRVFPLIMENKIIEMGEVVMANCWLEGDERIKTEDELFVPACQVIGEMLQYNQAIIKKK